MKNKSPAYHAALKLINTSSTIKVESHQDSKGSNYCLVKISENKDTITLNNITYTPTHSPHFTIYEYYKESETQGQSVFHFTWYGTANNNEHILHVYFNKTGGYFYATLKNHNGEIVHSNFNLTETKAIRQFYQREISLIFETLFLCINNHYNTSLEKLDEELQSLEILGGNLKNTRGDYLEKAKKCQQLILEKNKWSFNKDPRAAYFNQLIVKLENNVVPQKEPIQSTDKQQVFKRRAIRRRRPSSRKQQKKQARPIRSFSTLYRKLQAVNKNHQLTTPQKYIEKLKLLQNELNKDHSKDYRVTDNYILKVFKKTLDQEKSLKVYFCKVALSGNKKEFLELLPFVNWVDCLFFSEIVKQGTEEITELLLRKFPECVIYLNHVFLSSDKPKSSYPQETQPVYGFALYRSRYDPKSAASFLSMLLRNGFNPTIRAVTKPWNNGFLWACIITGWVEGVEVLLTHGVPANFSSFFNVAIKEVDNSKPITQDSISRLQNRQTTPHKSDFQSYLHEVVNLAHQLSPTEIPKTLAMAKLLLEHNASFTEENERGFDALGIATCKEGKNPHLPMTKILVKHGADINKIQSIGKQNTTPLIFATSRNYEFEVKKLVELGADPNVYIQQTLIINHKPLSLQISAFLVSAVCQCSKITNFFLRQTNSPIKFITLASTFSLLLLKDRFIPEWNNTKLLIKPVEANNVFQIIHKSITEKAFKKSTVKRVVDSALKAGKYYYEKKSYQLAILNFLIVPIFTNNPKEAYKTIFKIAKCFEFSGMPQRALAFYDICRNNNLDQATHIMATSAYEKLSIQSQPLLKQFSK